MLSVSFAWLASLRQGFYVAQASLQLYSLVPPPRVPGVQVCAAFPGVLFAHCECLSYSGTPTVRYITKPNGPEARRPELPRVHGFQHAT